MKNYILICLALVSGLLIGKYFFNENISNIEKLDNTEKEYISSSNIDIKQDIQTDTIVYKLPTFIENDLNRYYINSDNLDEVSWNDFLEKIRNQSIKNYSTHKGDTIFHLLLSSPNINFKTIEDLISQGFDINQVNEHGETPIMLALKNENINISDLERLVGKGAYLDDKAINYVLKNNNLVSKQTFMSYLKEKGFKLDKEEYFRDANSLKNKEYLKELLPNIDINFKVQDSLSSFEAVLLSNQDNEIIEYYLDNNVNLSENDGFGVLHAISKNDNISLENIQKIIDSGVDVDEPTSKVLMTPLMTLIANNGENNISKIELLLKNGANISRTNFLGKSAYDFLENIKNEEKKQEIKDLLDRYNN